MIDIHTHILPGVDDGAENLEEALQMLRIAAEDGIESLVVTPHVSSMLCRYKDLSMLSEQRQLFSEAIAGVENKPQICFGSELHLTPEIPELLQQYRSLLTINNSSYILIEFPAEYIFPRTRELISQVMMDGFIPIVVHPERNEMVQRSEMAIREFVDMGVLCQLNAGSLSGLFGKEAENAAFRLLHANMVHVIASDAHNSRERPPRLSHIGKFLHPFGQERIDLLLHAIPQAIIADEPIPDIGPVVLADGNRGLRGRLKRWFS